MNLESYCGSFFERATIYTLILRNELGTFLNVEPYIKWTWKVIWELFWTWTPFQIIPKKWFWGLFWTWTLYKIILKCDFGYFFERGTLYKNEPQKCPKKVPKSGLQNHQKSKKDHRKTHLHSKNDFEANSHGFWHQKPPKTIKIPSLIT